MLLISVSWSLLLSICCYPWWARVRPSFGCVLQIWSLFAIQFWSHCQRCKWKQTCESRSNIFVSWFIGSNQRWKLLTAFYWSFFLKKHSRQVICSSSAVSQASVFWTLAKLCLWNSLLELSDVPDQSQVITRLILQCAKSKFRGKPLWLDLSQIFCPISSTSCANFVYYVFRLGAYSWQGL